MEFVDAQRVANNSPPCTFTPDPPLEVRSMPTPNGQRPVGYLSFGEQHETSTADYANFIMYQNQYVLRTAYESIMTLELKYQDLDVLGKAFE